jgi:hypothetical protein
MAEWCLLAASLLLVLACRTGIAQVATARLEGFVRDPSGAIVPGATVSVVNSRTQGENRTLSTSQGFFTFLSLQPGLYYLRA